MRKFYKRIGALVRASRQRLDILTSSPKTSKPHAWVNANRSFVTISWIQVPLRKVDFWQRLQRILEGGQSCDRDDLRWCLHWCHREKWNGVRLWSIRFLWCQIDPLPTNILIWRHCDESYAISPGLNHMYHFTRVFAHANLCPIPCMYVCLQTLSTDRRWLEYDW